MKELCAIENLAEAKVLLHPVRVRLLDYLATPRTCRELAELVGQTQQRVNHHLKEMKEAGLIQIVRRQKKKNLIEATYQRSGKAYWLSPQLVRPEGEKPREFRDKLSLHKLLVMAETLQEDTALLLGDADSGDVPSLGLDGEIVLRDDAERQEFTKDLLRALHQVFEKYQGVSTDGERFKVMITAYPKRKGE